MTPDRRPPSLPRPRLRPRACACALLLAALGACGGGSGGSGGGGAAGVPPDGVAGSVSAPDRLLGRIAEREPNGTAALAYRLPPAFARTRLEVAGNLGVSAALYGEADPVDVLRFEALAASILTLEVAFHPVDPVDGGPTQLTLEVRRGDGVLLAQTTGVSPRALTVPAAALEPLYVTLAAAGHFPYVAAFDLADDPAPAPPKPGPRGAGLPRADPRASAPPSGPAPGPASARAPGGAPASCAADHVLVRLRPGVDPQAFARSRGLTLGRATGSGTWRMHLPAARGTGRSAAEGDAPARRSAQGLTGDPEVAFAEPDWIVTPFGVTADADLNRQWNLRAVGALEAWDVTRGSASIVIGVVDSGVVAHAELEGQLVAGYDFVSDPARARDGDGRDADPTDPGDRALSDGLSSWHGTHVSALIVGRADDGQGIVGLAPGCRVMPLRALGEGGGLVSDVADAILYAAGLHTTAEGSTLPAPLPVVNLSLGLSTFSAELESACQRAAGQGVLLVAASGNDGGGVAWPAAFPTVVAVGAVDGLLDGTTYSGRGPELSLVAPGGRRTLDRQGDGWPDAVLSAAVDETPFPAAAARVWHVGTSQAAPHVSGAAALLLTLAPQLTPTQVRTRLEQSALDRGLPGRDDLHGHGLLQVHTAVKRLLEERGTPLAAPVLSLPIGVVHFSGFELEHTVPVVNAGGGLLQVLSAQTTTDDGGNWLGATLLPAFVGADSDVAAVSVFVDRPALPGASGWWSGTVRLYGPSGSLGFVRVIVSADAWLRAGRPFSVVAVDVGTGGVPRLAYAHPETGYRYRLADLPPGTYRVKAGDDLDVDGLFCEPGDLCGWFGGASEADAVPLLLQPGAALPDVDVIVR